MLSDEQKGAIDGIFQDIAYDVVRGNGCYNQLDDMIDLVSGMLGDARNATLEEVAQMMEKHPPKVGGRALYKYWVGRLRQMREGK